MWDRNALGRHANLPPNISILSNDDNSKDDGDDDDVDKDDNDPDKNHIPGTRGEAARA